MLKVAPDVRQETELTWDVAQLFPAQGQWTEEDYFKLDTNHLVEFSHGQLEILEMPSVPHQDVVYLLVEVVKQFLQLHPIGIVRFAPLSVQLWPRKYREPDVVFLLNEHLERRTDQYWIGADLVMEVVSPESRYRDTVTKRREYEQARIPEYWIVDPEHRTITILRLEGEIYAVHGQFGSGEVATSGLSVDFMVDVDEVFAAIP